MLTRWLCGIALIAGTVLVQFAAQTLLARALHVRPQRLGRTPLRMEQILPSLLTVLILILGHLVQVALWAFLYLALGDLQGFQRSMYFSLASYTTVGAEELELPDDHRILGAVEAAVGTLMFGWSTALLVALGIRATDDGTGGRSPPPERSV